MFILSCIAIKHFSMVRRWSDIICVDLVKLNVCIVYFSLYLVYLCTC